MLTFFVIKGKDGVAASKNWKVEPSSSSVLGRMSAEKMDTQKVHVTLGTETTWGGGTGPPTEHAMLHATRGRKRAAPSVPEWSPTSALTGPDKAKLLTADGFRCIPGRMAVRDMDGFWTGCAPRAPARSPTESRRQSILGSMEVVTQGRGGGDVVLKTR